MKTRMEKWSRYRKRILGTSDERFENKRARKVSVSQEEAAVLTPYQEYRNKQRDIYLLKGGVILLTLVLFIIIYFLWVRN